MHAFNKTGWHATIAALILLALTIGGHAAAGQPAATPESGCPEMSASPVAGLATPTPGDRATPETATPDAGGAPHGQLADSTALMDALLACGFTVESVDSIEQPFLQPASSTMLRVSGGSLSEPADIQVFDYTDPGSADADAAGIGPDGNPTKMMIHWIATPHFFRGERMIALYVGEDQAVVDLLTTLLGPAFAGG